MKRVGSDRSNASSNKRRKRHESDAESDVSKGTDDSFMNELRSKNEGTYKWEDVKKHRSATIDDGTSDDDELYMSLKEKERQRRQAKRKASSPAAKAKLPSKGPKSPSKPPPAPHFPFASHPLTAIKPAKRKPGQNTPSLRTDDRRRPMTLSHLNNIRKKQAQEPPPDTSAIAVFRPDAVFTSAARTMRSGRGFQNAIGDIDTAISISQTKDVLPPPERRPSISEIKQLPHPQSKPRETASRPSVTDALARASRIRDEANPPPRTREETMSSLTSRPRSPIRSPVKSPTKLSTPSTASPMDIDTAALTKAWFEPRHLPSQDLPPPRKKSIPGRDSYRPAPPVARLDHGDNRNYLNEMPTIAPSEPPTIDSVPQLNEDSGRTWTGELVYSDKRTSFGQIRLFIPQSSTRIDKLPVFSGTRLHLSKIISAQYLNQRWLSPAAHPSKKPECLHVEFQSKDKQKALIEALRWTDSAGLVFEESCTLCFFFKPNERIRALFSGDGSSNPVGVALLDPIKLPEPDPEVYREEVCSLLVYF